MQPYNSINTATALNNFRFFTINIITDIELRRLCCANHIHKNDPQTMKNSTWNWHNAIGYKLKSGFVIFIWLRMTNLERMFGCLISFYNYRSWSFFNKKQDCCFNRYSNVFHLRIFCSYIINVLYTKLDTTCSNSFYAINTNGIALHLVRF